MVRQLKHHEKRLLKKVNFLEWKDRDDPKERHICQRFCIDDADDYVKYRKVTALIRKLAEYLKTLPANDAFREKLVSHMCLKLCAMGIFRPSQKSLQDLAEVNITRFCGRRLACLMHQPLKLAPSIREATKLIRDGHVQVAGEVVTQPAFHITRHLEDQVTWTAYSTISKTVSEFNNRRDDYELLGN